MYEDLLKMSDSERYSIANRIEQLKQIPPYGHYLNWLKSLKIVISIILALYAYSWAFEPTIGATGWINGYIPHASSIIAAWAVIGITLLLNYASLPDHMPTSTYFLATVPLIMYGVFAILSVTFGGVAFIAISAHVAVSGLTVFSIFFYTATITQYARETLEHQATRLELNKLTSGIQNAESGNDG